jgi:hypothetical protein
MSRKEREKRAAAEAGGDGFAEARCFVLSAGAEYKRRERASHAAIVLHAAAPGGAHPCVAWAAAAEALFARCAPLAARSAPRSAAHGCAWRMHAHGAPAAIKTAICVALTRVRCDAALPGGCSVLSPPRL